jgi:uncharacterized damage-inducible protein DinB
MNWKELIRGNIEYTFACTEAMIDLVDEDKLDWKPETGQNWMTTGQLLLHIATSCGAPMKGFATGDWGMPEGMDVNNLKPEDLEKMGLPKDMDVKNMKPEEMLPPAENLPTISSIAEAKEAIAEDKQLALETLEQTSEEDLATKIATAPWDQMELNLGKRYLQMIQHLESHKSQLFYYLKLQGKPVNTGTLWS